MNRAVIALLCLSACGNEAAHQNDGDLALLGSTGNEHALSVGKTTEIFISRVDTGPGECQFDVTRNTSYCTVRAIRKILSASCDSDLCTTFIVDNSTVDVTGHDAGTARFTVKVELYTDGGVFEDSTQLLFVNR